MPVVRRRRDSAHRDMLWVGPALPVLLVFHSSLAHTRCLQRQSRLDKCGLELEESRDTSWYHLSVGLFPSASHLSVLFYLESAVVRPLLPPTPRLPPQLVPRPFYFRPSCSSTVVSYFCIHFKKRNNPTGPVHLFVAAPGSLSILAQG